MAINTSSVRAPYRNYEENQQKILAAYKKLQSDENPIPSYISISKESGLSINTVYKHFKQMDFDFICKRARIHTEDVMKSLAEKAKTGSAHDRKLFFEIVEKFNPVKKEDKRVVGDLNTNTNISGELTVNVVKRVVYSKEEFDKIKNSGEQEDTTIQPNAAKKLLKKNDNSVNKKEKELKDRSMIAVGNATTALLGPSGMDII